MSILINKSTRVIVQGITGTQGRLHTELMLKYGTKIVAGTNPKKAGTTVFDVPVFADVKTAKEETGANASIIFVPPVAAADSIIEAIDAGLDLVVCITENIPALDMIRVHDRLQDSHTRLIGPNCPGLISVDECKLGIMPQDIHLKGHIGIVSRSGSLTYETIKQLSKKGIGQSTTVGIGGDPIKGTNFLDVLKAFNEDEETYAIVLIGEIGSQDEQLACAWAKEHMEKPLVAFIGGVSAPPGKRMGHAGAIISAGKGTAAGKIEALRNAGAEIADTPDEIGEALVRALIRKGIYEHCKSS